MIFQHKPFFNDACRFRFGMVAIEFNFAILVCHLTAVLYFTFFLSKELACFKGEPQEEMSESECNVSSFSSVVGVNFLPRKSSYPLLFNHTLLEPLETSLFLGLSWHWYEYC